MNRLVVLVALNAALFPAVATAAPSVMQLKRLKDAVTEDFKDPASAQFRRIERVDKNPAKAGEGIYCGEVNAKNSYGAYVGFKPFIGAIVGTDALAMKVAHDEESAMVVHELCRKAKAGEISQ